MGHTEELSEQKTFKVYDYETRRYYDVCSIEADGTYVIAYNCKDQDLKPSFLLSKKEERKRRKPNEVSKVITPPSEFALWNNAIVKVHTSLENNESVLTIYKTTTETLRKYGRSTGWKAETSSLLFEVKEKDGYKIGDIWCLKDANDSKIPVRISRLFNGGQYLVVEGASKSKQSYDRNLDEEVVKINSLLKCSEQDIVKFNLNPKDLAIAIPRNSDDQRINSQTSKKQSTDQTPSTISPKIEGTEK